METYIDPTGTIVFTFGCSTAVSLIFAGLTRWYRSDAANQTDRLARTYQNIAGVSTLFLAIFVIMSGNVVLTAVVWNAIGIFFVMMELNEWFEQRLLPLTRRLPGKRRLVLRAFVLVAIISLSIGGSWFVLLALSVDRHRSRDWLPA